MCSSCKWLGKGGWLLCDDILGFSSPGINFTRLQGTEESHHVGLNFLRVGEHIGALSREDTRETIEKTALKAKGERSMRIENLLACLGDIDLLDGLSRQSSERCFSSQRAAADGGGQPGVELICQLEQSGS